MVSPARIATVLARDLRVGPRSPFFLISLVLPLILTALLQGVFGSLFDAPPRLGIVDAGSSEIPAAARAADGLEISMLASREDLLRKVADHDLDAGLFLPARFDEAVRAGTRPPLELSLSAQSQASTRLVVATTVLDLTRGVAGEPTPVQVEYVSPDEGAFLPWSSRLIPLLVILVVITAGTLLPAASLVGERESGTLRAVLLTPLRTGELVIAKGLLGIALAVTAGLATLTLNQAFGAEPLALLATLGVAALMCAEIGLLLGSFATSSNNLFAIFKSGSLLLIFPAAAWAWPGFPEWIAKLGPTYYFLAPTYDVAIRGADFAGIAPDLGIGLAICAALVPAIGVASRRLRTASDAG